MNEEPKRRGRPRKNSQTPPIMADELPGDRIIFPGFGPPTIAATDESGPFPEAFDVPTQSQDIVSPFRAPEDNTPVESVPTATTTLTIHGQSELELEQKPNITVWASLGATIRTADYENQKLDIGVRGIPVGASDEFIATQMEKAKETLHAVVDHLAAEMGRRMIEDYGR